LRVSPVDSAGYLFEWNRSANGDLPRLIGVDTGTGDEVWVARPDSQGSGLVPVAISPDGGTVFAKRSSSDPGPITAFSAATGKEQWSSSQELDLWLWRVDPTISPDGSTIIISRTVDSDFFNYLTCGVDAANGDLVWCAEYDSGFDHSGGVGMSGYLTASAVSPDGASVYISGQRAFDDGFSWGDDYTTIAYWLVLSAEIDVRPNDFRNPVKPGSMGVIPVALLGSDDLDARQIDVSSLRFGPNEAAPAYGSRRWPPFRRHLRDVNHDGLLDLITHFRVRETGIACGDESADLAGNLTSGRPFTGTDSIRTVGCGLDHELPPMPVHQNPRLNSNAEAQTSRRHK
jgi:hypothetical protein